MTRFSLLLFVGALLPRLYVAIAWAREPVWDGHYYDIGARSIAAGLGYVGTSGGAWCHYPVGYSALLGAAYWIAGSGRYVAPVLNALVGALLAVFTYQLGRRAHERAARVAGLIVALYPGLIAYSALLMTEPVAALALILAGWVAIRSQALGGAIMGLGVLVRPQSLLCAPALAWLTKRTPRWRAALIATSCALLVVLPWTIRNCRVMDGCAFVSTNAGWNLAIGSFPRATGRFAGLRSSDGCRIVTGQVQQDRCWLELGLGWIAADPVRWLALVPKKLGYTFDHESFAIGYLAEADPERWPADRALAARGLLSWAHRLLLSAAALGVLPRPTRKRPSTLLAPLLVGLWIWIAAMTEEHPFWPLAVLIPVVAFIRRRALAPAERYAAWTLATVGLTHAIFFGEDRYHLVATPMLAILACAGWAARPERVRATA